MTTLKVRNLGIHYYTGDDTRKALDDVSIDVNEGEVVGVVGQSGSGKSVLARAILGLITEPARVAAGEVLFDDRDVLQMSESELEYARGRDIALILPNPRSRLNPLLAVGIQLRNVVAAKQGLSKQAAFAKAVKLIKSVDIADPSRVARMFPHELSGGMCQRIVIAMALANDPRLIVADEPTVGLDVTVQLQVLDLMVDLVREHQAALLLMTRDFGIVAHYCQRAAVLKEGRVVESESVRELFSNPRHPHSKMLLEAAFAARGEEQEVGSGERK